jgi:hypothetical protein
VVDISIGSDPEFIIVDNNGDIVSAIKFLAGCEDCNPCDGCRKSQSSDGCPDDCGEDCDNCDMCSSSPPNCEICSDCSEPLIHSNIGIDGCNMVGELRPRYSMDPLEHHANINTLIHSIQLPRGYKLLGGTVRDNNCIGGHIHIGYDECIVDNDHFASYLSYYCGIPLRRIEHPNDIKLRGSSKSSYGYFGDYHDVDYGLEFRMPASWLVDSTIAKAALCLAHVVAYEYINVDSSKDCALDDGEYKQQLDADNIDDIIKTIRGMEEFYKYATEINPLLEMIEQHQIWDTTKNIKETWQ